MRFGLRKLKVAREQDHHNFDLLGVHEVTWVKGGTEPKVIIYFSMRKGMTLITYEPTLSYIREQHNHFRG
jgi:hypothetical protein